MGWEEAVAVGAHARAHDHSAGQALPRRIGCLQSVPSSNVNHRVPDAAPPLVRRANSAHRRVRRSSRFIMNVTYVDSRILLPITNYQLLTWEFKLKSHKYRLQKRDSVAPHLTPPPAMRETRSTIDSQNTVGGGEQHGRGGAGRGAKWNGREAVRGQRTARDRVHTALLFMHQIRQR